VPPVFLVSAETFVAMPRYLDEPPTAIGGGRFIGRDGEG
jgi:hypothetical protein